jgi:hypothetical protein
MEVWGQERLCNRRCPSHSQPCPRTTQTAVLQLRHRRDQLPVSCPAPSRYVTLRSAVRTSDSRQTPLVFWFSYIIRKKSHFLWWKPLFGQNDFFPYNMNFFVQQEKLLFLQNDFSFSFCIILRHSLLILIQERLVLVLVKNTKWKRRNEKGIILLAKHFANISQKAGKPSDED